MLNFDICNAARLRRDPDFDGRFFIGVKSTGIYCRPVCPARQPLTKNVIFFPSAPAAEAYGLRPCLRCRPETAPFCPAWMGTGSTVERALKLIEAGALDKGNITQLADRLGIGARHLSRLFSRHIGASPSHTAQTLRVQRAKRLLNKSQMSMAQIAHAAGFNSLRRFNASFNELYGRSPSSLKKNQICDGAKAPQ